MPDGGTNSIEEDKRVIEKMERVFGKSQATGSIYIAEIEDKRCATCGNEKDGMCFHGTIHEVDPNETLCCWIPKSND